MATKEMMKNLSVSALRDYLSEAEHLDIGDFDPRSQGEFILEDGRISFEIGDNRHRVTQDAYVRLGSLVGIPQAYLLKTPHALMLPHVNHWLRAREVTHLNYASQNGVIQLFSKGMVQPVSNYAIINAVEDHIGGSAQVHHFSHDLTKTVFSLIPEDSEFDKPVVVGDAVRMRCNVPTNTHQLIS